MSRIGLLKWSPTSEIFAMGLAGMVSAAMEEPVAVTSDELLIASGISLPPSVFSASTETFVRLILILLVLLRNLTVHLYIISCMILWWPLFLEAHSALVLPWLVVSGVRNIFADVIALLTGTGLCISFGCLSVTCVEFMVIKGVTMAWSFYLYVSVLTFYLDLRRAPFRRGGHASSISCSRSSEADESWTEDKRLEMAVRRRMCRSMADEHELRRRLMESMAVDSDEECSHMRKALSLDEVQDPSGNKTSPRLRSLDTLLDRIETDWDQMSYLIERREDEKYWQSLESKARAFLMLTTNDISTAITHSRKRRTLQQRDQMVQTDMLDLSHMKYVTLAPPVRHGRSLHPVSSWHLQEEASRQLLGSSAYSYQRGSMSNAALLACKPSAPSHRLHSIVSSRLQTINRPAMQHFRDPRHLTSLECMSNKRGRRDLSPLSYIVMPPRFGYQHACIQVNRLTVAYIQQQIIDAAIQKEDEELEEYYGTIVFAESDDKVLSSDSLWTRYGSVNSLMVQHVEEATRMRSLRSGAGTQADLDARQSLAAVQKVREVLDHSVSTQTHADVRQALSEVTRRREARRAKEDRYQRELILEPTVSPHTDDHDDDDDEDGGMRAHVGKLRGLAPPPPPNTRNAKIQTDLDHDAALSGIPRTHSSSHRRGHATFAADVAPPDESAAQAIQFARAAAVHKQVVEYMAASEGLVLECTITPPEVSPSGSWTSDKATLADLAAHAAAPEGGLRVEVVGFLPLGVVDEEHGGEQEDENEDDEKEDADNVDDPLDVVNYVLTALLEAVEKRADGYWSSSSDSE